MTSQQDEVERNGMGWDRANLMLRLHSCLVGVAANYTDGDYQ